MVGHVKPAMNLMFTFTRDGEVVEQQMANSPARCCQMAVVYLAGLGKLRGGDRLEVADVKEDHPAPDHTAGASPRNGGTHTVKGLIAFILCVLAIFGIVWLIAPDTTKLDDEAIFRGICKEIKYSTENCERIKPRR